MKNYIIKLDVKRNSNWSKEKLNSRSIFLLLRWKDHIHKWIYQKDKKTPEFDVIRAIVDARVSQNLTQKQLAERSEINQADISKLENGIRNPSINLLKRLADGMDMALKIEFIPKRKI